MEHDQITAAIHLWWPNVKEGEPQGPCEYPGNFFSVKDTTSEMMFQNYIL